MGPSRKVGTIGDWFRAAIVRGFQTSTRTQIAVCGIHRRAATGQDRQHEGSRRKKHEVRHTQLFINNQFVNSCSGKTFPTLNPATEQVIGQIQEGDRGDIDRAVQAAKNAVELYSEWREMDASERGRLLNKLADRVEMESDYLAHLEALDNGKTVSSALEDILICVKILRYYGGWADKIHGDTIPVDGKYLALTRREPVGVVGAIIPWNYPFFMAISKVAPALATGCTLVLKPAEQTPLSAIYLGELVKEVGFPPGVLNVVPGYGPTAGNALTSHPDVDAVTFTGSTEVGKWIMKQAADTIKRVHLELGGKSPLIIFADADLEHAILNAHEACMTNHGQCCSAGARTFVEAPIYDKVVEGLKKLAENRRVGDPFDKDTVQGPQVSKEQLDKIMKYVDLGQREGAHLVTGGKRIGDKGYFIQPTVFSEVKDDMTIAREEIFGPVQSVLKFNTTKEVIERANASNYGLAAGVFTKDIEKGHRLSQALQSGTVWVNCYNIFGANIPCGGYKMSGFGRELGKEGLDFYTELKLIQIAT